MISSRCSTTRSGIVSASKSRMSSNTERVFVYGTLRRGGSNHFRMANAEFVTTATLHGRLYRIDWYPALVLDPAGDEIQGEVFDVPPEQMAELDAFEEKWAGKYASIAPAWRRAWQEVIPFFGLDPAIRKIIHTTNGPVTELFRSFDLVFCHKRETSWHRNQPRNSAPRQCV